MSGPALLAVVVLEADTVPGGHTSVLLCHVHPRALWRPRVKPTLFIGQVLHRQPLSLLPFGGRNRVVLGNWPGLAASWGHSWTQLRPSEAEEVSLGGA